MLRIFQESNAGGTGGSGIDGSINSNRMVTGLSSELPLQSFDEECRTHVNGAKRSR
jgi:hypothetical protein